MKEDSLFYFSSPNKFTAFLEELDVYNNWQIRHGLLNARGKEIEDRRYTKFLRKAFYDSGFFRMQVSIAEIVSWLDTTSLMERVFEVLQQKLEVEVFESIEMSLEYMIKMSKRMRIDYLLQYKDKVLLIEFRTVDQFNKIRPTWDYKFKELLQYKELMSYYVLDKTLRIYAFIPLYEYNGKVLNQKHRDYNNNQVEFFAEYIEKYLIK